MSLVCWSGGCDSTLVLADLLKDSSQEIPVRSISFTHPQIGLNSQQCELQYIARNKLAMQFKENGWHLERNEVELKYSDNAHQVFCETLGQAGIWLAFGPVHLKPKEDFYTGWIRGDDIWHKSFWLAQTFDAFQYIVENTGKLRTPLEWTGKADVLKRLAKLELTDLCWWCEEPKKYDACGKCTPCKTHAAALIELEDEEKGNDAEK